MAPKFSVIIPLYNKEDNIKATLESVFLQTVNDFEVIVVDDGSTDGGISIVNGFKDKRLKVYQIENSGVSFARNFGVQKSFGELIAFLDADDYWYPNHLENIYSLVQAFPEARWFATAYEIQHNVNMILKMEAPPMHKGVGWKGMIDNYFEDSMQDSLGWTSSICFKKNHFLNLGGFDIQLQTGQDISLWIKSALHCSLCFSSIVSSRYNLLGSNRITKIPTHLKRHMDLDSFLQYEKNNASLKKYMDRIRYTYIIKFKIAKLNEVADKAKAGINFQNLTFSQNIISHLNRRTLIALLFLKEKMEHIGMRIRTT